VPEREEGELDAERSGTGEGREERGGRRLVWKTIAIEKMRKRRANGQTGFGGVCSISRMLKLSKDYRNEHKSDDVEIIPNDVPEIKGLENNGFWAKVCARNTRNAADFEGEIDLSEDRRESLARDRANSLSNRKGILRAAWESQLFQCRHPTIRCRR
jgi:hypothetical protein